ncbi:MAG TPA: ATP-binding protein [Burkholderiaceae bacterium]|nr:ATP-binding protein [Burkholderiaceae bacterium]
MNGSTPIRRSDVLAAPPVRGGAPTDAQLSALRFFSVSRVIVALMLLLFAGLNDQLAVFESPASRQKFTHITQFYLLLAVAWLVAAPVLRRYFQPLLVAQVMTDLLLLTLLVHYAGGQRSGLGVLLVAAVAGASVLSTTALAGFFAAMAALLLLTETGWQAIGGDPADPSAFFRAGLIGAAGFVTAYVVNWLGVRLDRQEWLTRQRDADLRNQLAITQLVVAELQQGVLVVDDDGSVRTMNRAAQALLGAPSHTGPSLLAAGGDGPWSRIGRAYRDWHGGGLPRPEAGELDLGPQSAGGGDHRVRMRFLHSQAASGDTVLVLVLEDLRSVEERAQQLKLASMGRLSASIAHEIRNPLAAIRHANSLMAENLDDPGLQRLSRIVETNTVRINHIVEDVLSISRREPPAREPIDLARFLPAFLAEFTATVGTDPRRIVCSLDSDAPLLFDSNHLRQVLVNILSNALRYASASPGSVSLRWLSRGDDRLELRVADDGPGLAPEVLQHLFEPFFTTEARGTGLGLYLARELCHANGAVLRYERLAPESGGRGEFIVEPQRVQQEAR